MDRKALEQKYLEGTISKAQLGQLRRVALEELIEKITNSSDYEKVKWLNENKSRLNPSKLANAIGYRTTKDTLRQSLKSLILAAEDALLSQGVIISKAKSNTEISQDNEKNLLDFINERLSEEIYEWPINDRNRVYHRVLWAFFLDTPVDEIKAAPSFFSRNKAVKDRLAEIDTYIAKGEVRSLNYEHLSALETMEHTMTSAALSTARQKLKESKEKLAGAEEQLKSCIADNDSLIKINAELESELRVYKTSEEALLGDNVLDDIKLSGAY